MPAELSNEDVLELLSNPVSEIRAKLASKIATQITEVDLSDDEREIAFDIMRRMSLDVAVSVRQALAENLRHTPGIPGDVALALARDVESVALPMIESSPVFSDADLVELVRLGNASKQIAIARREQVSDVVSYALVETENSDAVLALMANEGAELSEKTLNKTIDLYGENEDIQSAMVCRETLPVVIAEKLTSFVAENLRQHLIIHHDLPAELAAELVLQSREQATAGLLSDGASNEQTARLVSNLYGHGRLSPTLMLRAACRGDMEFCEHAFSQMAAVPFDDARKLLHDPGPLGFEAIYERAGLPPALYVVFRLAIDVFNEIAVEPEICDEEEFSRRMIAHIEHDAEVFSEDDREYLIDTLNRVASSA